MESVAKFKKWHSERMGHPIGVLLAVEAIGDLEHRVNDLDSCAKTSNSRVVELKKDNDRLVEENAELREALSDLSEKFEHTIKCQGKNPEMWGAFRKAKELLAKNK